jgi:hypothetical protein
MNCFSFIAHLLVPLTLNVIASNSNLSKSKPKPDQGMRSAVCDYRTPPNFQPLRLSIQFE